MSRSRPFGETFALAPLLALTPLLALATLLGACDPVIGSATTGQLIEPPRRRVSPVAAIHDDCGTATLDRSLPRRPYVQRVTDDAASILWTSLADAESVELWEPGAEPRSFPAQTQETRFLAAGSTQRFVRVEGLEPGTVHCYSVVRDGEVVFGPSGFRTAPAPDDTGPIDVLVFGDSGRGSEAQQTLRSHMDTVPVDLVLHTGDVAYDDGRMDEVERWAFGVYQEIFESHPFYPTIGNHDDSTANAGPYLEAWELPTNADSSDPSDLERRYSFDWGPAHFVALDTEHMDEEQAEWLERDLAASDRPWKIVYGHDPPYSSGRHGSAKQVRNLVRPVLERHGVRLFLAGHDHHYERSNVIGGTTYVVTGGGGDSRRTGRSSFTAYATETVHFVSLRIDGSELRAYAIDGTGRVFDSFRLTL